jgi:hypothetical protein
VDDAAAEIEVVDPGAEHLAAPRPGVSGKDEQGVDERVACGPLDEVEQFRHLGHVEEQRPPEGLLFFRRESAAAEDRFDLGEGDEGRLLVRLRQSDAFDRRVAGQVPLLDRPIPDQPERGQLLLDRLGPDVTPLPLLGGPLVGEGLEVGDSQRRGAATGTDDPPEVADMDVLALEGRRLLRTGRECVAVEAEEVAEGECFPRLGLVAPLAVGEDEARQVHPLGQLQQTESQQPQCFFDADADAFGAVVSRLDRTLVLDTGVTELDPVAAGGRVLPDVRHDLSRAVRVRRSGPRESFGRAGDSSNQRECHASPVPGQI